MAAWTRSSPPSRSGTDLRSRVLFVILAASALLALTARAAITVRDADLVDFRCFYEAGRLVRLGLDPYDRGDWIGVAHTAPGLPNCALTFVYPMPTAMAMVPLSFVPERAALAIWELALVGSVLAGVALLARTWRVDSRPLVLLALWSQPTFSAVANGQFGPLVFLAFAALVFALAQRRATLALVPWAALLVKPHITLVVLVATPLLLGRARAVLALLVAAAVAVVSLLLVAEWPVEYVRELLAQSLAFDRGLGTLWTIAGDLGLPPVVGGAAAIALAAAFVAALPRPLGSPPMYVTVLVVVALLVTPYARPHDLIVLAVAWAPVLAASSSAAARVALVATALGLPWIVTVLTRLGVPLSSYALVPIATAALLVYALRRAPRLTVAPARSPTA